MSAQGRPELDFQSLPYGDLLSALPDPYADPDNPASIDDSTPHHFTGKERDAETGFANGNDYFGARYYASGAGRFLTPDWSVKVEPVPYSKLDAPQSLNLYAYVLNNPLTTADPDGHEGGPGNVDPVNSGPTGAAEEMLWKWKHGEPTVQQRTSWARAQQQNGSSGGKGFGTSLGHGLSNLLHGHSWNYMPQGAGTYGGIVPDFVTASGSAGPFPSANLSVSWVPSTDSWYLSVGPGYGAGAGVVGGYSSDPNGFISGWSSSGCGFAVVGGCLGKSGLLLDGPTATMFGVGFGGWGASDTYGIPLESPPMAPAGPMTTKVGDVYMEDPQMWIPSN